jgi:hypothetical protein
VLFYIGISATAIGAQPYAIEWSRQFGTHLTDKGADVAIDKSGNAYITGQTYGSIGASNLGRSDVFVRKYDTTGAELWTRQLGTSNWDVGTSIAIDDNGDAYVTGFTSGNFGRQNAGGADAFLTKIDAMGRVLWTTQTGTRNDDESNAVAVDPFHNVYITGYTEGAMIGSNEGGRDQFLAKFSSSGNLLWTEQFGTAGSDQGNSIATDSAGNIYISGSTESRATLMKFDGQGGMLWTKLLGMNSVRSDGVAVDRFDNVYVTGPTSVTGSTDSYLVKFDPFGGQLWTKLYGSVTALDITTSLALDNFGNVFLTGWTNYSVNSYSINNDVFLAKFNSLGTQIWKQEFGSTDADWGLSVTTDMRGSVYIAGRTEGQLDEVDCHCVRADDAFLVKFAIPEPSSAALFIAAACCTIGSTGRKWKRGILLFSITVRGLNGTRIILNSHQR